MDDRTFYARAGQAVTIVANPGAPGTALPPPALGYAAVTLLDSGGNVLGTAASALGGDVAVLPDVTLPADGVYHAHVAAPAAHPRITGFYTLTAADATVHQTPITVNETVTGQLEGRYSTERWAFSALAGRNMQFAFVLGASCLVVSAIAGLWWEERRQDQTRQEWHEAAVKHHRLVDEKEAEEAEHRQMREREERRHQEITMLAEAHARVQPRTERAPHPVETVDAAPPVDYSEFRALEDRRIVDLRGWQGEGVGSR